MAEPPSVAGALQLRLTWPTPPVAVSASGELGGPKVVADATALFALSPTLLSVVTA